MNMPTAYIGLGSNLESPRRQVETALSELRRLPHSRWRGQSPLYRSRPVGPPDQPDYVNAAAVLETELEAETLLDALQAIEERHGRRRDGRRWGARTLDLDLLLYGQACIDTPRLKVPHPEMHRRGFVLKPLFDLNPVLEIPGRGSIADLLNTVTIDDLEIIDHAD